MIDRINLLMKAKNVTAKQFAEEIGIQPSGMSHILSGRNNPSLDFVMKVVKRWPEVNINWLMFGKGEMYATVPLNVAEHPTSETVQQTERHDVEQYDLFEQPQPPTPQANKVVERSIPVASPSQPEQVAVVATELSAAPQEDTSAAIPLAQPAAVGREAVNATSAQPAENAVETAQPSPTVVQPTQKRKKVVKMIVMYDDHTFAEYYPE